MTTIIIHCDASLKNGWGCWVYKRSDQEKCRVGIVQSMNTVGLENMAAIKALQSIEDCANIFLYSDSLGTVDIINKGIIKKRDEGKTKMKLILEVNQKKSVEAIWVPSKHPCPTHQLVDSVAKSVLNEWLRLF